MANYIKNPKTIILSTHIIEEVSNLLEQVIIINEGKIMTSKECDELLENAYTVSGVSENIDKYIESKEIVNVETMAAFKSATVIGSVRSSDRELAESLDLKFSKVELQKLFIYLTENNTMKGEA